MTTQVARFPTTPVMITCTVSTCSADNTCDKDDGVDDAERHWLDETAVPGAQVCLEVLGIRERCGVDRGGVVPLATDIHVATFTRRRRVTTISDSVVLLWIWCRERERGLQLAAAAAIIAYYWSTSSKALHIIRCCVTFFWLKLRVDWICRTGHWRTKWQGWIFKSNQIKYIWQHK